MIKLMIKLIQSGQHEIQSNINGPIMHEGFFQ